MIHNKDPKERNSNEFSSDAILENDRKLNEINWRDDGVIYPDGDIEDEIGDDFSGDFGERFD